MPVTVSCACGKVFKVKDEMAGKEVTCQVCGRTVSVPALDAPPASDPAWGVPQGLAKAPAPVMPAPAMPRGPEAALVPAAAAPAPVDENISCPACAETISRLAAHCPFCGEKLNVKFSQQEQVALLDQAVAELDAHIASPEKMAEDAELKGGTISVKTIIAGILWVPCVLGIISGLMMNNRSDGSGIACFAGFVGVIVSICLIISLTNDFKSANISSAPSPETALRNFFVACKTGRYKKGYVALAPLARDEGTVETIKFKDQKIPSHTGRYSVHDLDTFKAYWKSIFTGPSGQTRQVTFKRVQKKRNVGGADDKVMVEVEVSVMNYPSWVVILILLSLWIALILYLVLRKTEKQVIRKLLIRRNDQWFIADSAYQGPLDKLTI